MIITVVMMYAVDIHVISCRVAPTDPRMWGSATLTIDESIVPMTAPTPTAAATTHLSSAGGASE
jgi:hypothetical protein